MSDDIFSKGWKLVPTNMRLYAEGMAGKKTPITNEDFTPEELATMRAIVDKKAAANVAENAHNQRMLSTPPTKEQYAQFPNQVSVGGQPLQAVPYEKYIAQRYDNLVQRPVQPTQRIPVQYGDYSAQTGRGDMPDTADQVKSSFTSPEFQLSTSLGRFVAHAQPSGDWNVEDTYHWADPRIARRTLPQALSMGLQGVGDYLATLRSNLIGPVERPVRVVLPAKGMVKPNE